MRSLHQVEAITIGYVRCACKWEYRVECFKGKTDEDLSAEVFGFFEAHKTAADPSER